MNRKDIVIRGAGVLVVAGVLAGGGSYIVNEGGSDPGTANLWIDGSGSCTWSASPIAYPNDGTECATFDAAEAACATAGTGGLIKVKAGTYGSENIVGTAVDSPDSADCVFSPADGETVTLSGDWIWDTVDDVTMTGFLFSAGCDNALAIDNTERFTVYRNRFNGPGTTNEGAILMTHGSVGNGIFEADDTLIEENWIDCEAAGDQAADGVMANGGSIGDLTIRGNLIERPHEDHLHMDLNLTAEASGPIVVEENVFRDAVPALGSHSDAIQVLKNQNMTIRNNVFDEIQHGIVVTDNTDDGPLILAYNNLFSGNGDGQYVNGSATCESGQFYNNTTIGTNGSTYDWGCFPGSDRVGNILMDDVDPGTSGDYNTSKYAVAGGNSIGSQADADVFANTGSTAVANVYPARVMAAWPTQASAGSRTIRDPRLKSDSSALGRAHPSIVTAADLLGVTRDGDPDGGAYERTG